MKLPEITRPNPSSVDINLNESNDDLKFNKNFKILINNSK